MFRKTPDRAYIILLLVPQPGQLYLILLKIAITKKFVNSTKKFIARQDCPTKFVSDNVTNQTKIRIFVQVETSNGNSMYRVHHAVEVFVS